MERKKENDASIDDLTYQYGNNNRLPGVAVVVASSREDWGAEDSELGYNANGNVIFRLLKNGRFVILKGGEESVNILWNKNLEILHPINLPAAGRSGFRMTAKKHFAEL